MKSIAKQYGPNSNIARGFGADDEIGDASTCFSTMVLFRRVLYLPGVFDVLTPEKPIPCLTVTSKIAKQALQLAPSQTFLPYLSIFLVLRDQATTMEDR